MQLKASKQENHNSKQEQEGSPLKKSSLVTEQHHYMEKPQTDNSHSTKEQTQLSNSHNRGEPQKTAHTHNTELTWEEYWEATGDTVHEDPSEMKETVKLREATTWEANLMETQDEDLMVAHLVSTNGYPNRYGARIPLKTKWNIHKFEEMLQGYADIDIIEWLKYGWPTGRLPSLKDPARTFKTTKG